MKEVHKVIIQLSRVDLLLSDESEGGGREDELGLAVGSYDLGPGNHIVPKSRLILIDDD